MTQSISFRDVEQITAYLDNQLPLGERQRLESRLQKEPSLRAILAELTQARAVLRKLPARRAPRNFRLTPEMAGVRPPLPRAFPFFRLTSALAAVLLFFAFAANLSAPALRTFSAAAPAPALSSDSGAADSNAAPLQPAGPIVGRGGGPPSDPLQATELAAMPAPLADTPSALTPTPELHTMQALATQSLEMSAPTETPAEPGAMAKTAPSQLVPTRPAPQPQPIQLPVPAWLQFGLLGLTVLSGGVAFFLRTRSDRDWFKVHALKPVRPSARQVLLFILILLVVVALAVGIALLSSSNIYAP